MRINIDNLNIRMLGISQQQAQSISNGLAEMIAQQLSDELSPGQQGLLNVKHIRLEKIRVKNSDLNSKAKITSVQNAIASSVVKGLQAKTRKANGPTQSVS